MVGALLSSGEVSMEGLLIGIDPAARAVVYPALELREGRFFEAGERGILLNRGVARKLVVGVGDTVVALGTTADGRLSGVKLTVTGVWMVRGLDVYEWGSCFASLAAVQELLDAGDAAGVLVFRQKDDDRQSAPVAASVNEALERSGTPARAYTWEEMGGPFIGGMIVTRFVGGILHIVLAIIAAFGVLDTALMSVFERTREIGTMRAVGTRRSRVVLLFLLERRSRPRPHGRPHAPGRRAPARMTLRLLAIAFRNLLRARRRNALAGGSMALGAAALVIASGLADGITRQLSDSLVAVQTGHLQVVVRPDDFQPQNNPFDAYGQDEPPAAEALARRIEEEGRAHGVLRAVPYVFVRGNAVAGSRSSVAWIVGIDPAREPALRAAQAPVAGSFLPADDEMAVYVAEVAARKLRVGVGDAVSFVVQTPQGAVNSLDAVLCGTLRKGAPWYDNAFYLTLAAAQRLVDWPGGATNVKVLLADGSPRALARARRAVEATVAAARPGPLAKGTRVRVESYTEAGRFSLAATGIPMKVASLAWMAGGDVLYPALEPESLLRATASIVLLSTLAAVYPTFSASRLEPREALNHV